jgi:hypothetical protein
MARATLSLALKTAFDGTWRPDYEPGPDGEPDVLSLAGGTYECHSCHPVYRVPADGEQHPVAGHPRFETIAVTVIDDWTVRLVGHRGGAVVYESTMIVAADGQSRTETWTAAMQVDGIVLPMTTPISGAPEGRGRPVLFAMSAVRIGSVQGGAHLLSGTWKMVAMDLVEHDEDTTYRIAGDSLAMSDRLGRSFTASLDGTVAPYRGDSRFTGVSLLVIDERTIEESNFSGDTVLQVTRWRVDPDGRTMHVQFDDTRGHVMEQTGHKLP